jgi:hypothetical protein
MKSNKFEFHVQKLCEERPARGGWWWLGENSAEQAREKESRLREQRHEMRGVK